MTKFERFIIYPVLAVLCFAVFGGRVPLTQAVAEDEAVVQLGTVRCNKLICAGEVSADTVSAYEFGAFSRGGNQKGVTMSCSSSGHGHIAVMNSNGKHGWGVYHNVATGAVTMRILDFEGREAGRMEAVGTQGVLSLSNSVSEKVNRWSGPR